MSERKKLIVVLMNCQGSEVTRYLRTSVNVSAEYIVEHYLNYTLWDDYEKKASIYAAVMEADVLISQNVQNVEWLRNDELARHIKPSCHFIRLAFWRFDGFWPISMPQFTTSFWYPPIDIEGVANFDEYISHPVNGEVITNQFESQVEKLVSLDQESDFSMAEYFLDNYKTVPLFSDHWHPTAAFFLPVCNYIIQQIGLTPDLNLLPNSMINRDRYRLVLDCVHSHLGLTYDSSILRFYDHWTTRRTFFDFASSALPQLAGTEATTIPAALFETWRQDRGLTPRALDVAPLGKVVQRGHDALLIDDRRRPFTVSPPGTDAPNGDIDTAVPWTIDLRDFRELTSITLSDVASSATPAKPLAVSISNDGLAWTALATIDRAVEPQGGAERAPLHLDLTGPTLARFVNLSVERQAGAHLGRVEMIMNVVGEL